jgi:hypothetical protein
MSVSLEHIKSEIRSLAPHQVELLLMDLQKEYALPPLDAESDAEIAATWDAEIAERMKEVEEARLELVSGQESERRMDALFAKHGLQRRSA